MLTLCNGILPLTQGLGQATCCKLVDYGCNPSTSENNYHATTIIILDI